MNSNSDFRTEMKVIYENLSRYDNIREDINKLQVRISDTEKIIAYIPEGVRAMRETWVERLSDAYGKFINTQINSLQSQHDSLERDSSRFKKPYDAYLRAKELRAEYESLHKEVVESRVENYKKIYGRLLAIKKEFQNHSPQMKALAESVMFSIPDTIEEVRKMMYNTEDVLSGLYNTDWKDRIDYVKSQFPLFSRTVFMRSDARQLIEKAQIIFNDFRSTKSEDDRITKTWEKKHTELYNNFSRETYPYRELCKRCDNRESKRLDKIAEEERERLNREGDFLADLKASQKRVLMNISRKYYDIEVTCSDLNEEVFMMELGLDVINIKKRLDNNLRKRHNINKEIKRLRDYLYSDFQNMLEDFINEKGPGTRYRFPEGLAIEIDRSSFKIPDKTDIGNGFKAKTGYSPDNSIFIDLFLNTNGHRQFDGKLNSFKTEVIKAYEIRLADLKSRYEELCIKNQKDKESEFKSFADLQNMDPAAAGFGPKLPASENARLIETIQTAASDRYCLPWIVNPFAAMSGHPTIPEVIRWQTGDETPNLNFIYKDAKQRNTALQCMNEVLVNILIAFKVKDVRLTFIDTTTSNDGAFFTTRLGAQVCNVVNRDIEIRQLCEQWQAKASMVGKYSNNLVSYNVAHKTMLTPYEIVIILGKQSNVIESQLEPFVENGRKYGLYFFNFSDQPALSAKPGMFRDFTYSASIQKNTLLARNPLDDSELTDAIFTYINTLAQKEETVKAISQDIEELAETPYGDAIRDFAVPVGEINGHDIYFKLSNQHIHSFVIGQTGQGKSVFLHDVIAGSILNYSPEQFQIYLLDFKLAGEELYHYKDVKHVRALLANGSDLKITFEVLNDLKNQMQERSNLMREYGARTLEEYNETAKRKIPRILLVVDECQELFRDSAHRQAGEASVMIDIRNIVEDIARKGRSQGVHLLFATQTLSGTQLPAVIKNNITDCFIFKCAHEDAEQLVQGSSKKIQQLKVGHLLYNSCDGESIFHSYLPDVDSMVDEALRKSDGIRIEYDRFVFDGNNEDSLDSDVKEHIITETRRNLRFSLGYSNDLQQDVTGGSLRNDFAENILFVGYNHRQTARASFNALLSMMISNKAGNLGYEFYCLDLLRSEDEDIYKPLEYLSKHGLNILSQSQSRDIIAELAQNIRNGNAKKCVLFILGQERFRAVRDEYEIKGEETTSSEMPRTFGRPQAKTYRSELKYILENGPESGIHTLLQIDKLSNLLFEGNITSRFVYRMFGYVCLLRCEKETEMRLSQEGLYPHMLSEDDSNLGAWFIDDTNGTKEKFTPFVQITDESVVNGLNI